MDGGGSLTPNKVLLPPPRVERIKQGRLNCQSSRPTIFLIQRLSWTPASVWILNHHPVGQAASFWSRLINSWKSSFFYLNDSQFGVCPATDYPTSAQRNEAAVMGCGDAGLTAVGYSGLQHTPAGKRGDLLVRAQVYDQLRSSFSRQHSWAFHPKLQTCRLHQSLHSTDFRPIGRSQKHRLFCDDAAMAVWSHLGTDDSHFIGRCLLDDSKTNSEKNNQKVKNITRIDGLGRDHKINWVLLPQSVPLPIGHGQPSFCFVAQILLPAYGAINGVLFRDSH